jgi:EAL domain-containing protein (putative c-di-GMP-specific phosphodiesterase class I)
LIETFVAFSEKIGCKIIAEGIETKEELSVLMDLGVHYGQGYLLAKPCYPKPEP